MGVFDYGKWTLLKGPGPGHCPYHKFTADIVRKVRRPATCSALSQLERLKISRQSDNM